MRTTSTIGALTALILVAAEALPCGGAFGADYTIDPAQQIVVAYHNGVETYVFNPSFCGKSESFGLILPIPSSLSSAPELGTASLYSGLNAVTAPQIVYNDVCGSRTTGVGGASWAGGGIDGVPNGTTVIQTGQVGIFDWALLSATSVESFTEWLSTNGYPNEAPSSTFQSYVDKQWYFIAFKVSPGAETTVSDGQTLCGSFGPVMLSFPVAGNPVVPAGIATVSSSSFQWDIYAVGSQQMRIRDVETTLRFSGTIKESELEQYTGLATVARAGDRLTELRVTTVPTGDFVLEPNPNEEDYRRTTYVNRYVECPSTGGVTGAAGGTGLAGSAGIAGGAAAAGGGGGITGDSLPAGGTTSSPIQATGAGPSSGASAGTSGSGIVAPETGGVSIATGGTGTIVSADPESTGGVNNAASGSPAPTTEGEAQSGGEEDPGLRVSPPGTGGASSGGSPPVAAPSSSGGASTSTAESSSQGDATNDDDDGGCSVHAGSSGPRGFGALILALFLALAAHGRRGRRER